MTAFTAIFVWLKRGWFNVAAAGGVMVAVVVTGLALAPHPPAPASTPPPPLPPADIRTAEFDHCLDETKDAKLGGQTVGKLGDRHHWENCHVRVEVVSREPVALADGRAGERVRVRLAADGDYHMLAYRIGFGGSGFREGDRRVNVAAEEVVFEGRKGAVREVSSSAPPADRLEAEFFRQAVKTARDVVEATLPGD